MAGGQVEEMTRGKWGVGSESMRSSEIIRRETYKQTRAVETENPHSPPPTTHSPLPAIRVKDLWKRYGAVEAVRGINLEVKEGESFGLTGPDGAGKTTTFQILGGVMEATSGAAEVFGRPAREMRSQTGYLTQAFSLYPDLSVMENIRYIGDLRLVPPDQIVERGRRYLRMFNM